MIAHRFRRGVVVRWKEGCLLRVITCLTCLSTIKLQLAKDPLKQDEDEAGRIKKALLAVEDSLEDEEREKITDLHVLSGSGSYEFTDPSPLGYSQYELVTYLHLYNQNTLLKSVCQECRLWFNNKFDDMYDQKEREISMVVERNERLRYILSELREDPTHVEDPEWTPEERPLTIMKVEEWEVPVRPYVSPSEQDILDLKMAEEEAHRLAEMADNFRELALINMMNGVLEVRWEEEIKKDIPLPKCMVEKQPEEFDEDDLRVVMEYEEKVKFLMSERERYKKMLDQERIKLTTARDTLPTQLLVRKESEEMRTLKGYIKRYFLLEASQKKTGVVIKMLLSTECFRSKIEEKEKIIESLQEDIQQLQKLSSECRGIYESQVNRDKSLEKNFKKDFPDMPALVSGTAQQNIQRPKMHQRIQTSVALVSELSRCSVSGEKPIFLIAECLDYLKGLDTLDSFSNASPNTSEETWAILCRIRRLKVESELKMKALSLEVTEADATVNVFQKKMIKNKEMLTSLQGELQVIRKEKLHLIHNLQIQLVIKQGLVEIDIQGFISDFEDAILINRVCVDRMNEEIKEEPPPPSKLLYDTYRRSDQDKESKSKTVHNTKDYQFYNLETKTNRNQKESDPVNVPSSQDKKNGSNDVISPTKVLHSIETIPDKHNVSATNKCIRDYSKLKDNESVSNYPLSVNNLKSSTGWCNEDVNQGGTSEGELNKNIHHILDRKLKEITGVNDNQREELREILNQCKETFSERPGLNMRKREERMARQRIRIHKNTFPKAAKYEVGQLVLIITHKLLSVIGREISKLHPLYYGPGRVKAGQRKLRTMHETTNFRRGILCKEWEHKKLRMEIEDLKEHLHTLEGIKTQLTGSSLPLSIELFVASQRTLDLSGNFGASIHVMPFQRFFRFGSLHNSEKTAEHLSYTKNGKQSSIPKILQPTADVPLVVLTTNYYHTMP
uniref:Uncharacterized protein n=1 Tax=Timema cristinae TaxID=61476 RepID=A0A7R9GUE9_TIMCR|nr:unnamed protein product [Timema cristinae]